MTKRVLWASLLAWSWAWAPHALAKPCFEATLPNTAPQPGSASSCTTCHVDFGGNTRNAFGLAFETRLDCNDPPCSTSTGGDNWCPTGSPSDSDNDWSQITALHDLDSDNDGYKNALELYAADDFTITTRARNPGRSDSVPCDTCTLGQSACSVDPCAIGGAGAVCRAAQAEFWTCSCGTGRSGDGYTTGSGCAEINGCDASALSNCVTGQSGNTCNDVTAPGTGYSCNCTHAAYTENGSGTACVNYNICTAINPCNDNGDNAAGCNDAAAPSTGNTCSCTAPAWTQGTPYGQNVRSCVNYNACTALGNPCNDGTDTGASCTDRAAPLTGNTCTCSAPAHVEGPPDGNGVRSCINYDACTALSNPCNDNGDIFAGCSDRAAPLTGNTCGCSSGWTESAPDGSGVRRCLDTDGCAANPCATGGDTGAQCNDVSAPFNGNTCDCSPGYQRSGVGSETCVNINECLGNPCAANGDTNSNCSENAPGAGYTCGCGTGYAPTGGATPVCANANACVGAALTACGTSHAGNSCSDAAPPSLSYSCVCSNAAYTVAGDALSCVNRDECGGNPCDDGAGPGSGTCSDVAAPGTGYTCNCAPGFTSNGTTCVDLNECSVDSARCLHGTCQNLPGGAGYDCDCLTGYQVDPGSQPLATVCVLENECTNGSNDCHTSASCTDQDPGFTCTCLPGYQDNNPANPGRSCSEINECTNGTHLCAPGGAGGTCTNTPGSYVCDCLPGYNGDGTTQCTNINECVSGTHLCAPGGAGGTCIDTPGAYTCDCNPGYAGDGTLQCTNINECMTGTHLCAPGGAGGTCSDTPGSYVCDCLPGYNGDGTTQCAEIDECANAALNNCDVNALCFNMPLGSFTCACAPGFDGNGVVCDDIDECDPDDPLHDCDEFATCTNQPGSYECDCDAGYGDNDPGEPGRDCSNLDECTDDALNDCDQYASCDDDEGSFNCTCNAGFIDLGSARDGECENIDECADEQDNDCDDVATCTDNPGSFSCACPAGYADAGSGRTGECSEIDECLDAALNDCDPNADCANTDGSYACTCHTGFTDLSSGTGRMCGNIDECADDALNDCSPDANCTDNPGSYSCACRPGFFGDGRTCSNFNECDTGTHNCSLNADCTDTPGGFTCACRAGYTGSGTVCTDVNECDPASPLHNCPANANCNNVAGSFNCSCADGYAGNGQVCTDVDECTEGSHDCNQYASCANTVGSFSCACNSGFLGDGRVCTDIDECAPGVMNLCNPRANCRNDVPGQYRCECWTTYDGNGVSCFDKDECSNPNACSGGRSCRNLVADTASDPGFECSCPAGQTAVDAQSPCQVVCGDGVLASSEGCEGDVPGCTACEVDENWVCTFDPDLGESECSNNCADGFVDPGEECDDGAANSDTQPDGCRSDCRLAHCGDGVLDPGNNEQCDDGRDVSVTPTGTCRADCQNPRCGDGTRDNSEECDDGNNVDGDGCGASCSTEPYAVCEQQADAGPDLCSFPDPDAGVQPDAGELDAGLDAGDDGMGDGVAWDGGGIPPFAPSAKSNAVAGCSAGGALPGLPAWSSMAGLVLVAFGLRRRKR